MNGITLFPALTRLISLKAPASKVLPSAPDVLIGANLTMKLTKNITLAVSLVAAVASHAQTPATASATASGLLGQQYTELSFGLDDLKHVSTHGYSVSASANTALIPGQLDAGGTYSYSWMGGALRGHANTIGGYTTAYLPLRGVKPFASAALGYQWTSARFGLGDDQAVWAGAIGVEIPAGKVTITPRISYADDFRGSNRSTQAWTLGAEANYWYSRTSAVFAGIGFSDVRRSSLDSWNYEIGLRAKF